MIRSFFQSLEEHRVSYLLISGQASVLYGAATFSEDIDLWIAPAVSNLRSFMQALAAIGASIYKLTPPLQSNYVKRGHGFHFLLPDEFSPAYLDVMGMPPRVPSFPTVYRRCNRVFCDWGKLPLVSIPDLVELKKTRRLADYEVISKLVRIRLHNNSPTDSELRWALNNVFRIEDAEWIFRKWAHSTKIAATSRRTWLRAYVEAGPRLHFETIQSLLAQEIAAHQHRDILYWSPIIEELRTLRKHKALVKQGTPARALL